MVVVEVSVRQDTQVAVRAFGEGRLYQDRVVRRAERQISDGLRLKFLVVAFSMAELVRDDVRLEDAGVPEDGDVAGKNVARTAI